MQLRRPSLAAAIGCVVAATGAAAGIDPIADNSMLTHIATGRLLVDGFGFPHTDPYTFTAAGQPWAVQSWFASLTYGLVERLGGLQLVRIELALSAMAVAAVGWRLTRPAGTLLGRLAAVVPFLVVGFNGWGQRPLLLGLLFLGLALLAADDDLDPRWLVPVGWLWLNSHGSWPLGLVAIGCLAAGRRLDGERPTIELRAGAFLAGGLLLGAANPYGPRLLTFPITLLGRRESLRGIVEWQPPKFDNISQLGFLVLLAAAVVAIRRRPSWRATLPLVVFVVAALLGARNVQVAALVALPGLAFGLRDLGTVSGSVRSLAASGLAAASVAMVGLVLGAALTQEPTDTTAYPVGALRYLRDHGVDRTQVRIVSHDYVGNFLELLDGAEANVFIDDRAELTPVSVGRDYRTMLGGRSGWDAALDRYDADVVLWDRDLPLAELLALSPDWVELYSDRRFVMYVPVGSPLARP